jgi:hypothetical protein
MTSFFEVYKYIEIIEQAIFQKSLKFGLWAYKADVPRFLFECRN